MQVTGFLDRLIILQLLLCDCQKKVKQKHQAFGAIQSVLKTISKLVLLFGTTQPQVL